MIKISVRNIQQFKEVVVDVDRTSTNLGFLSVDEAHKMALDLIEAACDLCPEILNEVHPREGYFRSE